MAPRDHVIEAPAISTRFAGHDGSDSIPLVSQPSDENRKSQALTPLAFFSVSLLYGPAC
jgi:hypothetical protein